MTLSLRNFLLPLCFCIFPSFVAVLVTVLVAVELGDVVAVVDGIDVMVLVGVKLGEVV